MPRFLDTSTGQFVWMDNPREAVYAILSHTWRQDGESEQSYNDLLELQRSKFSRVARLLRRRAPKSSARGPSILSHPRLSEKIKGACKVAREAGFRLLWIDSCCINISSSAELSEAINSMYEWYSEADVCYVYLADVPDDEDPRRGFSRFRLSRWHRRGWTLQELIAPERVVFLSQTWRFLGTKTGLARTLQEITGVDFDILTRRASVESVSVARRMSWAAERETTRVEDRAYSLLGIFGVHMPPIYGEGLNAFLRLQEEIIKTIPDQSVLAWGPIRTFLPLNQAEQDHHRPYRLPGLLAQSPEAFQDSSDITPLSHAGFVSRIGQPSLDPPPLHCVFTPEGVRAQLLCIDLDRLSQLSQTISLGQNTSDVCTDCMRLARCHTLALLRCEDGAGFLIVLPLCRPTVGVRTELGMAVTTHISCQKPFHEPLRTVRVSQEMLDAARTHNLLAPTEVSILHHHQDSDPPQPKSLRQRRSGITPGISLWGSDPERTANFRIAPGCTDELRALGFTVSSVHCERSEDVIILTISLARSRRAVELYVQVALTAANRWESRTRARFSVTYKPHAKRPFDAGSHRTSYFDAYRTAARVLAEADFVVHTEQPSDVDVVDYRLLRLRLERPLTNSVLPEAIRGLWINIAVELSEPRPQIHPINGVEQTALLRASR